MMIGLKIAASCLVLFSLGAVLHWVWKKPGVSAKDMPDILGWLGLFGIVGIPLGLILAIFGV